MSDPNSDLSADLRAMASISAALLAAVDRSAAAWVRHCVGRFVAPPWSAELDHRVDEAGERCRLELVDQLSKLFAIDIAAQSTTPLVILRGAHVWPTEVLEALDVAAPRRDPFDERMDPTDRYGLAPRGWADFGEEVAESGLMWGAAKAHLHLRRRAGQ